MMDYVANCQDFGAMDSHLTPTTVEVAEWREYGAGCDPRVKLAVGRLEHSLMSGNVIGAFYEHIDEGPQALLQLDSAVEIAEIVDRAKSVLGLSVIQIAEFVGVSRPSLYNHMSGKEEPKSLAGYDKLHQLTIRIEQEVGDVSRGLKSVLVNGETLLSMLKSTELEEESFISAAKLVAQKLSLRGEASPSSGHSTSKHIVRSITKLG